MAIWHFVNTDVKNDMDPGMVAMTLNGTDNPTETILINYDRVFSMLNYQTWIFGASLCPFGPYTPLNNEIFPGGKGSFKGPGLGCALSFEWQQDSSTEPRAEGAHKLVLTELSKLDTKALKESIKVLEDAKIRHSDNAEIVAKIDKHLVEIHDELKTRDSAA